MLSKPFHFFLYGFVFFIHTAKGQQLIMPCEIGNSSQAKYIFLKVDNMELQSFDLKNNQFHCVEGNPYYNKCMAQMNETYRMGNLVRFMVKEAWKELDRKSWQCYVRYNGYNGDILGQMKTISLQDRNLTVTEIPTIFPTSVTAPDTGKSNVSSPNVTNAPNVPAKKDNTKTFSSGVVVGAFFGGFFLCFLVLVLPVSFLAIRLYYYKPVNGNLPSQDQDQNGNVAGDSSATQGQNVPLQRIGESDNC